MLQCASHGYEIACFGSVGASDMIKNLFDVPYNPLDFSQTFPVIVPVSYQRQFVVISEPKAEFERTLPTYLPLLRECTKVRDDALELQKDAGESKYLLGSLHKVFKTLGGRFLQQDGFVLKTAEQVRQKAGNLVMLGAKKVLSSMRETPGVVITEIEE